MPQCQSIKLHIEGISREQQPGNPANTPVRQSGIDGVWGQKSRPYKRYGTPDFGLWILDSGSSVHCQITLASSFGVGASVF